MRYTLSSLIVLTACGGPSLSSLQDGVQPYDPNKIHELGRGVASLESSSIIDRCVTDVIDDPARVGKPITGYKTNNGKQTLFSLEIIESTQQLIDKLGLKTEISASGLGAFGGSAKASFSRDLTVDKYSVVAVASVKVMSAPISIKKAGLTASAAELYKKDRARFTKKCGDEFISAYKTGGEFYAYLRIKTNSEQEKRNLTASLTASYGPFSGSGEVSKELQETLKSKEVVIKGYQNGGDLDATFIDLTIEEFARKPNKFPGGVKDTNEAVFEVITENYDSIDDLPDGTDPIDYKLQREIIGEINRDYLVLKDYDSSIAYARQNLDEFTGLDLAVLNAEEAKVRESLNALASALKACTKDPEACSRQTVKWPNLPEIKLPERALVPRQVMMRDASCGVELFNLARTDRCGVDLFHNAASPACGPAIFNLAESGACGVAAFNTGRGPACGTGEIRQLGKKEGSAPLCSSTASTKPLKETDARKVFKDDIKPWEVFVSGEFTSSSAFGSGPCPWHGSTTIYSVKVKPYNECAHADFGVARFNACRHPDHGVEVWNTCRHESHGVERWAECRHEAHGVELYRECLVELPN